MYVYIIINLYRVREIVENLQGDREERTDEIWKSVLGDDIKSVKDPGKITKQRQDQTYPKLNLRTENLIKFSKFKIRVLYDWT